MSDGIIIANGLIFVFGGCSANVLCLEGLIQDKTSNTGNLVTFCQFLFITLTTAPSFLLFDKGRIWLKPLHVPLRVYLMSVLLFYISSFTNNSVFMYNISIPLHIVFRCFSTVITMVICWLVQNRKYSKLQVISTIFLTIGTIIVSLYRDREFSSADITNIFNSKESINFELGNLKFVIGICLLIISSLSSSLLSVYNEWTYQTYGKYWQENLFYTHLLSLPFFLLKDGKELAIELQKLRKASKIKSYYIVGQTLHFTRKEILLFINVITQNICIRGVNILASHTNALTLSVILTVRKFISLLLSVIIYKNFFSYTSYFGAGIVFLGTLLYILGSNKSSQSEEENNKIR